MSNEEQKRLSDVSEPNDVTIEHFDEIVSIAKYSFARGIFGDAEMFLQEALSVVDVLCKGGPAVSTHEGKLHLHREE